MSVREDYSLQQTNAKKPRCSDCADCSSVFTWLCLISFAIWIVYKIGVGVILCINPNPIYYNIIREFAEWTITLVLILLFVTLIFYNREIKFELKRVKNV
jgi:uncharacterized protein with PQ loop repeat